MKAEALPLDRTHQKALRAKGKARLRLGAVTATPAALLYLSSRTVCPVTLLARHRRGDWGDVSAAVRARNDQAAAAGLRVESVYVVDGLTIRVVTEPTGAHCARRATCLLLGWEC